MNGEEIEKKEEIIFYLEELDSTFAVIKNQLREIRMKIGRLCKENRVMLEGFKHWCHIFHVPLTVEVSPLSELALHSIRHLDVAESPNVMSTRSPNNPFIDHDSSSLLNRMLVTGANENNTNVYKSEAKKEKCGYEQHDSEEHDSRIIPFDKVLLPDIFQNEEELLQLYEFINRKKSVTLEDVINNFECVPGEKLAIFINLLCRKNFVKQKNKYLTIVD
ncbi:hypothetical protein ENBRE01_0185 [Enteropsectra breve]|nr:hypothetical protein ENBRE01_0185 [Enteropsectra breve]